MTTRMTMSRPSVHVIALAILAVLAALLPAPPALADDDCTINWEGTESNDFRTEGNWDEDRIPGSDDIVCIDDGENLPVVHDGVTTIAGLANASDADLGPRLRLTAGALTVTDPSTLTGDYELQLQGGNLVVDSSLTLDGGELRLGGGSSLTGDGITRVIGEVTLAGTTPFTLTDHELVIVPDGVNRRSVFESGTTLAMQNGAILRVERQRQLGALDQPDQVELRRTTITGDGELIIEPGARVVSTGGTGANIIEVPVTNRGLLRVDGRNLNLNGGGVHTGSGTTLGQYNAIDVINQTLTLDSGTGAPMTFAPGSDTFVFGQGTINARFSPAVIQSEGFVAGFTTGENGDLINGAFQPLIIDADVTLGNLRIGRGGLQGSGDILVLGGGFFTDRTSWQDGTIEGPAGSILRYEVDLELPGGNDARVLEPGRLVVVEGDLVDTSDEQSHPNAAARIASGARMEVEGATTLQNLALTIDGDLVSDRIALTDSGRLGGTGTLTAAVDNAGTVAPGSSPGTLTIDGDYDQIDDGTLEMELAGTDDGAFDVLEATGTATLDGELQVELIGGFEPEVGDTFEILTADAVTGTFSTESLPDLGEDAVMFVVYGPDVVLLVVTAGEEPDIDFETEESGGPEESQDPEDTADPTDPVEEDDMTEPTSTDPSDDTSQEQEDSGADLVRVEVTSVDASADELPETGASTPGLIFLAMMLMLLGTGLVRRRPQTG